MRLKTIVPILISFLLMCPLLANAEFQPGYNAGTEPNRDYHVIMSNFKVGYTAESFQLVLSPFPLPESILNVTITNYANSTYPINIEIIDIVNITFQNIILPKEFSQTISGAYLAESMRLDAGNTWKATISVVEKVIGDGTTPVGLRIFLRTIDGVDIPGTYPPNTIAYFSSRLDIIFRVNPVPYNQIIGIIFIAILVLLIWPMKSIIRKRETSNRRSIAQ